MAIITLTLVGLGFGGCAQRPQEVAASHGKEYFPASIYGPASKRVIADGQPVPRGGGQYLVGKPYTIAGRTYYPSESRKTQIGNASWYGDAFHGRLTANGEIYDRDAFTAASPTMPLPSYARVTNLRNNYSMIVRVNDRGPYASDRIMDVSRRVAEALDYKRYGTTTLKVEYVGRASLAGSDDAKLYATLQTESPANGLSGRLMTAQIAQRARLATDPSDDDQTRRRRRVAAETPEDEVARPVSGARRSESAISRRRVDVSDAVVSDAVVPSRRERLRPAEAQSFSDVPPRRENAGWSRDRHSMQLANNDRPNPVKYAALREQREGENESLEARRVPAKTHDRAASGTKFVLPPSRPMDLGTIPGAGSQIRASREQQRFHVARSREN